MTERFATDRKGTVHFNITDTLHPTPNGPGIIATSHSDLWAKVIIDALNYCDTDHNDHAPIIPKPTPKETNHDT